MQDEKLILKQDFETLAPLTFSLPYVFTWQGNGVVKISQSRFLNKNGRFEEGCTPVFLCSLELKQCFSVRWVTGGGRGNALKFTSGHSETQTDLYILVLPTGDKKEYMRAQPVASVLLSPHRNERSHEGKERSTAENFGTGHL